MCVPGCIFEESYVLGALAYKTQSSCVMQRRVSCFRNFELSLNFYPRMKYISSELKQMNFSFKLSSYFMYSI